MVFCDDCTAGRLLIHPAEVVFPPDWDSPLVDFDPREPQRCCEVCAASLLPRQHELQQTTSNAAQPAACERDGVERYLNMPIQFNLADEIKKATNTLINFTDDNAIEGSDSVPSELIAGAHGLAFITTMQAGFFFSARAGSGLVVARTPDGGWSAPSAVCMGGAGWGFQIGGEVTDMLIVLNSEEAVAAFASKAQLSLGTELSIAVGPMGRSAETNMTAGDGGVSAVFSYAHSKGLFLGIALHACVIVGRDEANISFYGTPHSIEHILSGAVERPRGAEMLYDALDEVVRDGGGFAPPSSSARRRYADDEAFARALQEEEIRAAARGEAPRRPVAAAWGSASAPPGASAPPPHPDDSYGSWLGGGGSGGGGGASAAADGGDEWANARRNRVGSGQRFEEELGGGREMSYVTPHDREVTEQISLTEPELDFGMTPLPPGAAPPRAPTARRPEGELPIAAAGTGARARDPRDDIYADHGGYNAHAPVLPMGAVLPPAPAPVLPMGSVLPPAPAPGVSAAAADPGLAPDAPTPPQPPDFSEEVEI